MKKAVYIGNTEEYVSKLKEYWGNDLFKIDNNQKVNEFLNNTSFQISYILYEQSDIESDIQNISVLKKQFQNLYFILITSTNLEKTEAFKYLKAGISATLSNSSDINQIKKIVDIADKKINAEKEDLPDTKSLDSFKMPIGKRMFDIVMSVGALTALSPVFLITAILIRLESKGPIIYTSKRVGSNYKIFDFIKFRSMYPDADKRLKDYIALNQYGQPRKTENTTSKESQLIDTDTVLISDDYSISETEYIKKKQTAQENAFVKYEHDPRITKVGRIIRKYSIDELPQLINILKGDMSFVGNRPLPLYEAEMLTTDNDIDRFLAPAGLTGLWQVERRGDASSVSAEERKQLDIYYAQHCSFWFDIKLLFKTFTSFIQKDDV